MTENNGSNGSKNNDSNKEGEMEEKKEVVKHIPVNMRQVVCPVCQGYTPGCDFCNYTMTIPFGIMPLGVEGERKLGMLRAEYWRAKEAFTTNVSTEPVKKLKTPYTKAVTRDRPQLKRMMSSLFSMIKERETLIMAHKAMKKEMRRGPQGEDIMTMPSSTKIPVLADRIMRQWWSIEMMAKWETGEGTRASEVIMKETLAYFVGVREWDNYNRGEETGDGPFATQEQTYTASLLKAYGEAKRLGESRSAPYLLPKQLRPGAMGRKPFTRVGEASTGVLSILGLEAIAYDEWEARIHSIVDSIEASWNEQMKKNPKHGTIKEMGRQKRELDERLEGYWGIVADIKAKKLPKVEYALYLFRKCKALRELYFDYANGKKQFKRVHDVLWPSGATDETGKPPERMKFKTQAEGLEALDMLMNFDKEFTRRAGSHLTIECNSILWAVQYLGKSSATNWTFFKEYDPERAGANHKESTWKPGENNDQDMMGDDPMHSVSYIEYQDLTESDSNPEEALLQMEMIENGELSIDDL